MKFELNGPMFGCGRGWAGLPVQAPTGRRLNRSGQPTTPGPGRGSFGLTKLESFVPLLPTYPTSRRRSLASSRWMFIFHDCMYGQRSCRLDVCVAEGGTLLMSIEGKTLLNRLAGVLAFNPARVWVTA